MPNVTTAATNNAPAAAEGKAKKDRSPKITWGMMIQVINILAYTDENEDGSRSEKPEDAEPNSVTTHDIARWFNSHEYDATTDCVNWTKATKAGTRPSTSIYQWLTGKRKELADLKDQMAAETHKYLEETLDSVETSEAKETDFDSIVSGIKSLGLFRVPANMVRGSDHVGTNGQPVGMITLDNVGLRD